MNHTSNKSTRILISIITIALLGAIALTPARAEDPPPPKEIPNIFTPNGDGINDVIELESPGKLELCVFNRSGGLVFKASGRRIQWDGKDQRGKALSDGIYFYSLKDPAKTYANNRGFIYISRVRQWEETE